MRRWALLIAALYGAILAVLTAPGVLVALAPLITWRDAAQIYAWPPFWLWLAVMVAAQAALLAVPVSLENRRPVARRALWLPVTAAGLMAGLLAAGAVFSLAELCFGEDAGRHPGPWHGILGTALAALALVWIAWAVVFQRMGARQEARGFIAGQCALLLKGSVLELLIAVPTHLVARYRDYCCAGFLTFIGLTCGLAVMLFAFGPAVFFLYADRWRKLHPPKTGDAP